MYLYKNKKIIGYTIFDKKHLNNIKNYRWRLDSSGYVGMANMRLHNLIMGIKSGFEVDHINRNKLDNRDINLRWVNRAQNSWNKKCLGVHKQTYTKKWIAQIRINNKTIHLGTFDSKKDALISRKSAEKIYHIYN